MTKQFSVGDRVAYGAQWLRSVCAYTGDLPFLRGTVTAVGTLGDNQLCTIAWDKAHTGRVIAPNLTRTRDLAFDAAS